MTDRRLTAVVLAAAAIAAGSQAADADSPVRGGRAATPQTLEYWASEDLRPPFESARDSGDMFLARTQCPRRRAGAPAMSLSGALAHARAYLRSNVSRRALRAFAASRDYRIPARLRDDAVVAAAKGVPRASLAALLRAHDLAPRDPMVLVDTAAILNRLELYREALGVITGARGLAKAPPGALGIKAEAAALNNRGYALLKLGHYKEARAALDRAVALAPQLSEARTNRSAIDLCRHRTLAVRDRGRFRGDLVKPTPTPPPVDQPQPIQDFLKLSDGRPLNPQFIPAPASVEEAALNWQQLARAERQLSDAASAAEARSAAAQERFERHAGLFARRLRNSISAALEHEEGLVRDEESAPRMFAATLTAMSSIKPFDCGSYRSYYEGVRVAYVASVDHETRWIRTVSAKYDGWSRAFKSLDARRSLVEHQLFVVMNEEAYLANYLAMAGQSVTDAAWMDANGETHSCWTTEVPTEPPVELAALSDDGGCTQRPIKFEVFEIVEFEQECENLSIELHSAGWVGLFGRATVDLQQGALTLSAGVRMNVPVGPLKFMDAEAKLGFYMTIDRNNHVSEAGFVKPEGSIELKIEHGGVSVGTTAGGIGGGRIVMYNSVTGW